MSTLAPELPASSSGGFVSDLAGMPSFLIDPPGAAQRVHSKRFWIGPLLLFSILSFIASGIMIPITRHVLEVTPLPPNTSPEQFQRGIEIGMTIQRVAMYFSPLIVALLFAIQTAVLLGTSALTGVKAKFWELFNLIAGCSLIQMLAAIAGVIILKAKGEISTKAELRPALGLDIFLPEGTNKYLSAFLGYFSVFEIWWMVMMVLILSVAFRVSKGKAVATVAPLIVISLLFRLVAAIFS